MRCYDNEIKRGLGGLFSLGFSRQTNFLSYGIQSTLATHDYLQLGMLRETAHPNFMTQSYVALAMGKAGSLSLSYTQLQNNFFYPNQVYSYPFPRRTPLLVLLP